MWGHGVWGGTDLTPPPPACAVALCGGALRWGCACEEIGHQPTPRCGVRRHWTRADLTPQRWGNGGRATAGTRTGHERRHGGPQPPLPVPAAPQRPDTGAFLGHACGAAPGERERRGQRRPSPRLAAAGPAAAPLLPSPFRECGPGRAGPPHRPRYLRAGAHGGGGWGKFVSVVGCAARRGRSGRAGGSVCSQGSGKASGRPRERPAAGPWAEASSACAGELSPSERQPPGPSSMGHRGERASCLPLLFLLLLLLAFCRGRVVRVPKGPLIRVLGTEVVIPCSVSDYDGPSEQNFDWEFSRETDFMRIVSTWDSTFTSEEYQKRVGNGDIKLRRSSNDAVELVIRNIQPTDQGTYKCSTPSTDATVQGNYDAEVQVKVISDGLSVSGSKGRSSMSLRLSEGDSFKLRCSAITTSPEHTHLHVTWQIKSGSTWRDILSLTHEGKFHPGPGYEERYRNGDIRLDTGANDTYRLSVSQASSVDGGAYRCLVSEWVRGADSSWQKIQEKSVEIATVAIQRTALDVVISTSNVSVTERDSLDLTCNITTDRSGIFQAEVMWYFSASPDDTLSDAQILLSVDRDSVVSDSTLISLSHVDRNSYRLLVRDVDVEDSGYYYCQAAVWVPLHNGSWYKVVERTSAPVSVVVTALEPDYEVYLNASKTPKFSDDPTELNCRITNAQDTEANIRFTVSWYYRKRLRSDDLVTEELLATMDADWTLLLGDRSRERTQNGEIIFSKKAADTFSLRIQWTSESDRGDYFCVISAWSRHRNNSWIKSKDVTSASVSIFWATQDYMLTVEAVKLKPFFVAGHTFEMTCKVSSKNIKTPRYSVLITAEKPLTDQSNPNGTTRIISLNQDSVVRLEDWTDQTRVDGVVLEKVQENEFRYRMYQTQISDAGLYRCVVTAWSPGGGGMWREAVNGLSNPIQIDFQTSGPVFNVSVHSDNPTIYQGELADLLCIVTTEGMALEPDDMSFDVSWFAVRSFALDREPVLLASLDRRGIVTQSRRNGSSDLSLERISPLEFRLRVHGCEDHDFGNHYCVVTPWVRSATGVWQREPDIKAKPIFLSVKMDVLNAFKYPLLIGIGLATVIGLLSCLIGYCSSRWCCKKEVQETRRERRRLMSMEMD